jgi:uncharacterized protein
MNAADNKRLMQDIFAGLAVGDSAMFRQHLAKDARLIVMGKTSWSRTVEGVDAMMDYWRYVRSILKAASKSIPERFIADGDLVAIESRGDNEAKTGERYDNHYCMVFQLREGRIIEMREYMDTAFTEQVFGPYP